MTEQRLAVLKAHQAFYQKLLRQRRTAAEVNRAAICLRQIKAEMAEVQKALDEARQ